MRQNCFAQCFAPASANSSGNREWARYRSCPNSPGGRSVVIGRRFPTLTLSLRALNTSLLLTRPCLTELAKPRSNLAPGYIREGTRLWAGRLPDPAGGTNSAEKGAGDGAGNGAANGDTSGW